MKVYKLSKKYKIRKVNADGDDSAQLVGACLSSRPKTRAYHRELGGEQ